MSLPSVESDLVEEVVFNLCGHIILLDGVRMPRFGVHEQYQNAPELDSACFLCKTARRPEYGIEIEDENGMTKPSGSLLREVLDVYRRLQLRMYQEMEERWLGMDRHTLPEISEWVSDGAENLSASEKQEFMACNNRNHTFGILVKSKVRRLFERQNAARGFHVDRSGPESDSPDFVDRLYMSQEYLRNELLGTSSHRWMRAIFGLAHVNTGYLHFDESGHHARVYFQTWPEIDAVGRAPRLPLSGTLDPLGARSNARMMFEHERSVRVEMRSGLFEREHALLDQLDDDPNVQNII